MPRLLEKHWIDTVELEVIQARSHHSGHDLSVLPCVLPARRLLAAALTSACLALSPAEAAITVDPNGVGHDDVTTLINGTPTMLNSVPGNITLLEPLIFGETSVGELLVNDGSSLSSLIDVRRGDLTIESGGSDKTNIQ